MKLAALKLKNIHELSFPIKKINKFLSAIIIFVSIYIIFSPLIPELQYRIARASDETKGYKYESNLFSEQIKANKIDFSKLKPKPKANTLVIPKIGVDSQILEGTNPSETLDLGTWRRPNTSTPDQGGNTVLTGHRFQYTSGPNTFYSLDKLEIGDKFLIFWEEKEYDYEVFEIKVVSPDAIEVENDTDEAIVTLYTCTPLWTARDRLVVRAKLLDK